MNDQQRHFMEALMLFVELRLIEMGSTVVDALLAKRGSALSCQSQIAYGATDHLSASLRIYEAVHTLHTCENSFHQQHPALVAVCKHFPEYKNVYQPRYSLTWKCFLEDLARGEIDQEFNSIEEVNVFLIRRYLATWSASELILGDIPEALLRMPMSELLSETKKGAQSVPGHEKLKNYLVADVLLLDLHGSQKLLRAYARRILNESYDIPVDTVLTVEYLRWIEQKRPFS